MGKVLIIQKVIYSCVECPFFQIPHNNNPYIDTFKELNTICNNSKKELPPLDDIDGIPEWCQLSNNGE